MKGKKDISEMYTMSVKTPEDFTNKGSQGYVKLRIGSRKSRAVWLNVHIRKMFLNLIHFISVSYIDVYRVVRINIWLVYFNHVWAINNINQDSSCLVHTVFSVQLVCILELIVR